MGLAGEAVVAAVGAWLKRYKKQLAVVIALDAVAVMLWLLGVS